MLTVLCLFCLILCASAQNTQTKKAY